MLCGFLLIFFVYIYFCSIILSGTFIIDKGRGLIWNLQNSGVTCYKILFIWILELEGLKHLVIVFFWLYQNNFNFLFWNQGYQNNFNFSFWNQGWIITNEVRIFFRNLLKLPWTIYRKLKQTRKRNKFECYLFFLYTYLPIYIHKLFLFPTHESSILVHGWVVEFSHWGVEIF